jgi:hypothetical protein
MFALAIPCLTSSSSFTLPVLVLRSTRFRSKLHHPSSSRLWRTRTLRVMSARPCCRPIQTRVSLELRCRLPTACPCPLHVLVTLVNPVSVIVIDIALAGGRSLCRPRPHWIRVLSRARANLLNHTSPARSRLDLVVVPYVIKKSQESGEDEASSVIFTKCSTKARISHRSSSSSMPRSEKIRRRRK